MPYRRLVALAALATFACSPDKIVERPQTLPTLTAEGAPSAARRGPILLHFKLADPEKVTKAMRFEYQVLGAWAPATAKVELDASGVRVTWDSFRDVNIDGIIPVRFVAQTETGEAEAKVSIDVRNDPETNRILLVGLPMRELEGGGVNSSGTGVGVLLWSSREGKILGESRRIEVGRGPVEYSAAPHGRATAILEEADYGVSIVSTPLSASVAETAYQTSLKPPHGHAQSVRWSKDGRYLYVLSGLDSSNPPGIWRYEPAEDLSSFGEPTKLITLPGPPSRFAIDPVTGQLLVACGPGLGDTSFLMLYAADGTEQARIEEDKNDTDFANDLRIHPAGGMALWASDWIGDRVRRFRFDDQSLVEEHSPVTSVAAPYEIVFHPSSPKNGGAALITNIYSNAVTPLEIGGDSERIGLKIGGIPLAAEMDVIERGSHEGSVFITAVTEVFRVALKVDGSAENKGSIYNFGDGTEQVINGIGMQR